jgi:hypothetical protein
MVIGALIGAAASVAGGLMGANAQQQSDETNFQIALMNYYENKRQFDKSQEIAEKLRAEGKLGETDIWGNHTYWDPVKGWVTVTSDEQNALLKGYQRQELAQLSDLDKKRAVMDRNLERQGTESRYADSLFDAMLRVQQENPQDIVGLKNLMAAQGIAEGMSPMVRDATRGALRVGDERGAAEVASRMGIKQGDALRQAFMQNMFGARDQSENDYNRRRGGLNELYQQFAKSSGAIPDVSYNPRNIEGSTAQMASGARNAASSADAGYLNAASRNPPNFEYESKPNMGYANTVQNLGTDIASIDSNMSADKFYKQQAGNYFPPAPSTYGMPTGSDFLPWA